MKAFITGIAGFVGSHLAELLIDKGYEVRGTVLPDESTVNIDHLSKDLGIFQGDIRKGRLIKKIVLEIKPDQIYHLAAVSFVPTTRNSPRRTYATNFTGTLNLLEAVREAGINPRILYLGSAEQYGQIEEKAQPITEDSPLSPISPYAVSKASGEFLAYQYCRNFAMEIIRLRPFNHTGPRQSPQFVCSDFASQIAQIERGKREPVIFVGNLEARRDFSDVRDIVNAYWLALEKAKAGEVYNICSGKAYSIREILKKLLRLSKIKIEVKVLPEKQRPAEIPLLVGDYSKFRRETGWKPKIPLEQTLRDLLQYWRNSSEA